MKSAAGEGSTAAVDLYISRVIGGAAPLCTSAMYMGHDKGERGAFVKKQQASLWGKQPGFAVSKYLSVPTKIFQMLDHESENYLFFLQQN